MKELNILALAIIFSFSAMMAARSKNIKGDNSSSATLAGTSTTEQDQETEVSDENLPDNEIDIRDINSFVSDINIKPVPFNYDKYDLSEEARSIIRANAAVLNSTKRWNIIVEGYCDNRGTTEYNISLGQKRANAVRDYYVMLGVKASRIGTISYGTEKPLCYEETEDCWQMNRRAETKVK